MDMNENQVTNEETNAMPPIYDYQTSGPEVNATPSEEVATDNTQEKKKLFDIDEDVVFKQTVAGSNVGRDRAEAIKKSSLQKPVGLSRNSSFGFMGGVGPSNFGGNKGFAGIISLASLFAIGFGLVLYFVLKR